MCLEVLDDAVVTKWFDNVVALRLEAEKILLQKCCKVLVLQFSAQKL